MSQDNETPPCGSVAPQERNATVEEWTPSGVVTSMWVGLAVALGLLAFFLFGLFFAVFGASPADGALEFNLWVIGALTVLVLFLHQLIHAGAAKLFGGSPGFDLDVIQYIIPAMYVRVTGQHFTRWQFCVYTLSPLVVLSAVTLALMPLFTWTAMLVIPLAVNAGLSTRDFWMAWVVSQMPRSSLVQVQRDGLRLIRAD